MNRIPFEVGLFLAFGVAVGFVVIVSSPAIKQNDDCKVYKVDPKVVTSFVLKPPPAPEPERPVCPAAPAPKCEQVTPEADSVSKPELTNKDESKPRRRHHRYRRYWR